jgi:hypothetical protein
MSGVLIRSKWVREWPVIGSVSRPAVKATPPTASRITPMTPIFLLERARTMAMARSTMVNSGGDVAVPLPCMKPPQTSLPATPRTAPAGRCSLNATAAPTPVRANRVIEMVMSLLRGEASIGRDRAAGACWQVVVELMISLLGANAGSS